MAVVPVCYNMPYIDPTLQIRLSNGHFMCDKIAVPGGSRCSISSDTCRRQHALYPTAGIFIKRKRTECNASNETIQMRGCFHSWSVSDVHVPQKSRKSYSESHGSISERVSRPEKLFTLCCGSHSSTKLRQLNTLDAYFEKLHQDAADQPSSDPCSGMTEMLDRSSQISTKKELEYLELYIGKLNEDENSVAYESSTSDEQTTAENLVAAPRSIDEDFERDNRGKLYAYEELGNHDGENGVERSQLLQSDEEISDLYLISALASINIAVFLFEIASPVSNPDVELFSLPSLYGAKINDMILDGEWWRLVTPMFLHSGLLHVALSCWGLLTFGPQVCKGYGSFTFLLLYMLGGLSGNITSFLHTPKPTVGGTGPVFAIIGAWLIYQIQNKDVIPKDVSESMFQKAMATTALSFILSHFGPIDDWTHLGAILTGIAYGFFTSLSVQVHDASSRTGGDEGITLVERFANPCKSLFVFSLLVLVLSSLVFLIEPPLISLEVEDFLI